MANYTAHNSKVFKVGLKKFVEQQVKPKLLAICKSVAQNIVSVIDGSFAPPEGTQQFPIWSNNLHDATGVGVYCDGALSSFIPTARATKAQSDGETNGIFGSALLQSAIANASTQFHSGIWIVLFSSVSYAYKINTQGSPRGRGAGFFEALKQTLLNDVIAGLQPVQL